MSGSIRKGTTRTYRLPRSYSFLGITRLPSEMSMNSTLDALTKIMKPTTSDDDMQVDQQHGSNSDDGNLQQRLSNLKTPTAEELVAKVR
jgi:hypothetical protein